MDDFDGNAWAATMVGAAPCPGEWRASWHVLWCAETGSTNADLVAAAGAGAPDRTVLVADHQTAGRGRLDRRWEAPPATNLLASVLLRDVGDAPHPAVRRLAVAAARACELAGAAAVLKWPNDLLLDGRKLAGILAEMAGAEAVVIGIGINVGWAPAGAARLPDGTDRLELLRHLLRAYDELSADPFDEYRDRLATIGARVRVQLPQATIEGTALGVERDGRLVVLDTCAVTHRFDVGDVVHLRPRVQPG